MARLDRSRDGWFRYRTRHGFQFIVDRQDPQTFWMHAQGHPDLGEISVLQRWCKPGDTCCDIGANIGFMTALLAAGVGSKGRVHAFEPGPATYKLLERNTARLGLATVHLHHRCVAATEGQVDFFVAKDSAFSPLQSLHPPVTQCSAFSAVSVASVSLDSFVAGLPANSSLSTVKIDVEGAESEVLEGAQCLIHSSQPPLFDVEISPVAIARTGGDVAALARKFHRNHDLLYVNLSDSGHPWPIHRLIPLPAAADRHFPALGSLIAVPKHGHFAARGAALASLRPHGP
jgi:FkbM family methyltransferase